MFPKNLAEACGIPRNPLADFGGMLMAQCPTVEITLAIPEGRAGLQCDIK